jgi:hypothetical protein
MQRGTHENHQTRIAIIHNAWSMFSTRPGPARLPDGFNSLPAELLYHL